MIIRIKKYVGFTTFNEMQEFIKDYFDNKPVPNIVGHGYNDNYLHYFEVEE
jgi:hypothetical protein